MAVAKPMLRDWVLGLADQNKLGLMWTDRERSCFSIPWGKDPEAHGFIQSWAVTFGKYNGAYEFSKWKHSLRCALDSQFTYQSEPVARPMRRVYQRNRPPKTKASPAQSQTSPAQSQASPISQPQTSPAQPQTSPFAQCQASPFYQSQDSPFSQSQTSPSSVLQWNQLSTHESVPGRSWNMADALDDLEDLTSEFSTNPCLPVQEMGETCNTDSFTFNGITETLNAIVQEPVVANLASEVAEPEMYASPTDARLQVPQLTVADLDIKVFYRGLQVLSQMTGTNRCVIWHDATHSGATSPPQGTTVVSLPAPVGIAEQRRLTARILEPLAPALGGLVLDTDRRGVYGTRHTLSHVYWSGPGTTPRSPPVKLPRGERVCLFKLEAFVHECKEYLRAPKPCPQFEVLLCFGEKWPKGTMEEKLIMVKVVPTFARTLVEIVRRNGGSPFDGSTVSLQISDPLSNEMMDVDDLDDLLDWITNAQEGPALGIS